ncbi:uncharacterized protein FLJ76381-like [Theropithecus gelada]|uniref:uncharacterized protein FLJ76381-like n=1 Tax=Theropithecus gelada TaxID=9565 RepID=UPI000DC19E69|nr:uncharacterized protein FLJ76381-like [Theropithecus gelada]
MEACTSSLLSGGGHTEEASLPCRQAVLGTSEILSSGSGKWATGGFGSRFWQEGVWDPDLEKSIRLEEDAMESEPLAGTKTWGWGRRRWEARRRRTLPAHASQPSPRTVAAIAAGAPVSACAGGSTGTRVARPESPLPQLYAWDKNSNPRQSRQAGPVGRVHALEQAPIVFRALRWGLTQFLRGNSPVTQ